MSLLSIAPSASKSLISSTRELKALCRTIPRRGRMCRQRKSVTSSMSISSTTTVSGDGVQRRIGDYHSNLWDDDFIQSLSSPYGMENQSAVLSFNACGRSITLNAWGSRGISKMRYMLPFNMFTVIGAKKALDVEEIAFLLISTQLLWGSEFFDYMDILCFQGRFSCSANHTESGIRSVFNLFRASLIAFPGEKVMEEAEIFSATYLKEILQTIPVSGLSREIEYVLEYRWHSNLPRLEARTYIDILADNTVNE